MDSFGILYLQNVVCSHINLFLYKNKNCPIKKLKLISGKSDNRFYRKIDNLYNSSNEYSKNDNHIPADFLKEDNSMFETRVEK